MEKAGARRTQAPVMGLEDRAPVSLVRSLFSFSLLGFNRDLGLYGAVDLVLWVDLVERLVLDGVVLLNWV